MTQAIIDAVEAATGEPFKPHAGQRNQISNMIDPEADIVADIPDQIGRIRARLSELADLPPELFTVEMVTDRLTFMQAKVGVGRLDLVKEMPGPQRHEVGRLQERMRNPITGIYLRVFNRMPDEPGFDFWNGVPLRDPEYSFGEIERDMRAAKANGAT